MGADTKSNISSSKMELTNKTSFIDIIENDLCKGCCDECLFENCALRD